MFDSTSNNFDQSVSCSSGNIQQPIFVSMTIEHVWWVVWQYFFFWLNSLINFSRIEREMFVNVLWCRKIVHFPSCPWVYFTFFILSLLSSISIFFCTYNLISRININFMAILFINLLIMNISYFVVAVVILIKLTLWRFAYTQVCMLTRKRKKLRDQ